MNPEFIKLIENDSPWHNPENKTWYEQDGALRLLIEAKNQDLFEPTKINLILRRDFFNELIGDINKWGILILRGPRRVGKTSTLKYIIKELIDDNSIDPKSLIYLSLDKDELFVKEEKRRFLRELMTDIIKHYKKENKPLFIILDEVTFYEGWARALKNIYDEGILGPGIGVITTGSYSLDLSSAKRELSGRWGPLGDKFGGDVFYFPRRFIEVAESLMNPEFNKDLAKSFDKFPRKIGIIEYLAGFQTEDDDAKYGYKNILNKLLEDFYSDLHQLFQEIYTYAGGYPKSLYEAKLEVKKTGKAKISDARYRDDIFNLLVTDSKKFKLSEDIIDGILRKITLPSMERAISYSAVGLKKTEEDKYKKYLKESGLFAFLPCITSDKIDVENKSVSTADGTYKLVVIDPAAFIAIYLGSRGVNDEILNKAKQLFAEKKIIKEHLFESILISHLGKSMVLGQPFIKNCIGYIKDEEEEMADTFIWHINSQDQLLLIAVEAKSSSINEAEIKKKAKITKEKFHIKRLLVIANCDYIKFEEDYVILPIEIFLLLL